MGQSGTTFPSKGHNAHSVMPYKYSNMATYTGNVHTKGNTIPRSIPYLFANVHTYL